MTAQQVPVFLETSRGRRSGGRFSSGRYAYIDIHSIEEEIECSSTLRRLRLPRSSVTESFDIEHRMVPTSFSLNMQIGYIFRIQIKVIWLFTLSAGT